MPDVAFERIQYRGNYALRCVLDFSDCIVSAEYLFGYREDVIVGPTFGLRAWALTYSALTTALIEPPDRLPETRADYIWNFFSRSKAAGNRPFILTCPRDGKDYLVVFADHALTYEMLHTKLSTTGLMLKQTFARGVNFLDDGSLGAHENPDEI